MKDACKGLMRENCLPPDCVFTDGKTRKYCRKGKNKNKKSKSKKNNIIEITDSNIDEINDNCKGLTKENCLPPNCNYIIEKKKQYCRKSKNKTFFTKRRHN